jgi:hypothetical protein
LAVGQALPLVAAVPNWFEVQMADGRAGYVSKRSTDLGTCPAGVGIQPAGSPVTVATPSQFELHAIDVGTGLAVLVRGPDFTLMYDAGSNDDTAIGDGNRAVAYLKTLQPAITRIDHVVLSHPHQDHVQLLGDVVRTYRPRAVWNSGAFNGICGYRDFLAAIAADTSIQYHTAHMDTGEETVALKAQTCNGSHLTPLPGALDACLRLKHTGFDLVCVTAMRDRKHAQCRAANLRELGFPLSDLYVTGMGKQGRIPKAGIVNRLNPLAFVDDYLPSFDGIRTGIHLALVTREPNGSPNTGKLLDRVSSTHQNLAAFARWWLER